MNSLPLFQKTRLENPVLFPEADMSPLAHAKADAIAENCPRGGEPDQVAEVEIPLRRQGTGEHDENGARDHDPHKGERLREG